MTDIGRGIGTGIKTGILALLGINVNDTLAEGKSVGAGFMKGFLAGFEWDKITQAFKKWAEGNKLIVAGIATYLGIKLYGVLADFTKGVTSLATDIKNIFAKGSKNGFPTGNLPTAQTVTTMTVTANIVNIYGKIINNAGEAARTAVNVLTSAGGAAAGTAAVTAGAAAGKALLTGGSQLALPAATGAGAAAAGGIGSGYVITAPTTAAGTEIVLGTTGSMLTAGLAKTGIALGSTASTVGGAAAAGAAGSAGIIGGILGLGSAAIDLIQGIGKSKAGDAKGAKDEYVTAGTKAGMLGIGAGGGALAGAAIGAAGGPIGAGIGALIGLGVGGVGALLGGSKAGKALSDASDPGGWIADKWGATGDWISDKGSGFSDWFDTSVWTPVKDVGISAINIAAGAWSEVRDWIGDKWTSFKGWLGGLGQKGSKETGLTTSQGKGSVFEHAYGGIMTKPHMGIVAEAGAESIIPLSPSKRTRDIDLWRETGELLGIRQFSNGGIVGGVRASSDIPIASGSGSGGVTIKIEVAANPEFTIGTGSAGDDEQILTVLKAHIRSMADDIGDELAERLARIFVNMPLTA